MRKSISVSMSDELLKRIDEQLSDLYPSRSDFIRYACTTVCNQNDATKAITEFNTLLISLSKSKQLTEEEKQSLEQIDEAVKLIRRSKEIDED